MIALLVLLIFVGVALYLVQQIPMDPSILLIIRVVVILAVVLYVLAMFGVLDLPVPHVRR